MKILIGTETYYPDVNGCSYFTQRLAAGIQERGHQVHVICPSRRLRSMVTRHGKITLHGIPSVPMPLHKHFRVSMLPFFYNHVLREVKRIKPDIIHIQSHFLLGRALIQIAQELEIPLIATNHFVPTNLTVHLPLPERIIKLINSWLWRDFVKVYNRVETITTPTDVAAQLIRAQGIVRPITTISCGVDLNVFKPQKIENITKRATCIYVGRLEKEKHVDELIKALPLVRREVDAQLVIVGIGKQLAKLIELAKRENVSSFVAFTGFIEDQDLPKIYATCDVFCIAGVAELQSIVTMEAMATAKPIIAVNALALPHLVQDGLNGYTYQLGDIKTLASHLIKLLSNQGKREIMGKNSLEIITQHNINRTLTIYEKLYQDTIGRQIPSGSSILDPEMCDTKSLAMSEAYASSPVSRAVLDPSLRHW